MREIARRVNKNLSGDAAPYQGGFLEQHKVGKVIYAYRLNQKLVKLLLDFRKKLH